MDIQTKDGILLRGIPDGTPDDVIKARIEKIRASKTAPQEPEQSLLSKVGDVAGDIGAGAIKGASQIGATILSPFDAMGLTGKTSDQRRAEVTAQLKDWGADPESLAFKGGEIGTEILGTLPVGGVLGKGVSTLSQSPKALAIAEALRTGGMGMQAAGLPTRMAAGGAVGGTAAGLIDPEQTGVGAAIGTVLPGAQHLGGKAIGKVVDALTGRTTDVKTGKILRDVAGDKLDDIKTALSAAPNDITAAQAVQPVGSDVWSALGKRAQQQKSQYFSDLGNAQEAKRLATLKNVSPDLEEAEKTIKEISKINYNKAFNSDAQRRFAEGQTEQAKRLISSGGISGYSPRPSAPLSEIVAMKGNPIIDSAAKEAATLAASKGIKLGDPRASLEGLHYMKLAIDNQFKNRSASTALQNYSDEALKNTKQSLLDIIEGTNGKQGISPLYKIAREQHAELSKPIDQAKVIEAMTDVLKKTPEGGERVQPFLNVMGRGESALLKRADQSARFGGIEDVLTPTQMAARDKVASELMRDADIAKRGSAGAGELSSILNKDASKFRLPTFLRWEATVANKGLDIAEDILNKKTMDKVYTSMKTGKSALDAINTLPAEQRVKVINAMMKAKIPLTAPTAVGLGQGE